MTQLFGGQPRPLPFDLQFSANGEKAIQTNPADISQNLDWPTADETERVAVVLELSLQEYVVLASAVDVGRDIAYNENSNDVWWIWVRSIRMSICDQIADCIANNAATQAAMTQYLIDSGAISPNSIEPNSTTVNDRMPQSVQDTDIYSPPDGCDNDILWAGIKEIALRLDDNARNILEVALVINDIAQRYSTLISAIPVIGSVAGNIAKGFTETIPDIYNSFNAYSSESNVEELACTLFEIVCEDCRYPTFAEVAQAIASNALPAFADWSNVNIATALSQFIQTGSFTPSLVWHSMLIFELVILYMNATFNGNSGTEAIGFWAALGEDEPSDDWELLCDCVPPDYPVPKFIAPCFGGGIAGQNLTNIGGVRWRAETTHRSVPDEAVMIGAVDDVAFQITNIAWSHLPFTAQGYQNEAFGCFVAVIPQLTNIRQFGYTWPNGAGLRAIEFDMLPAT